MSTVSSPYSELLKSDQHPMRPHYFKLEALERYWEDPRYNLRFLDIAGSISVQEQYQGANPLEEEDRISMQCFGLAYGPNHSRGICVYLVRLDRLSPSHQQRWQGYEVPSGYGMVNDYYLTSIEGTLPEHISAYQAFLIEQILINELAKMIAKPVLSRNTISETHFGNSLVY